VRCKTNEQQFANNTILLKPIWRLLIPRVPLESASFNENHLICSVNVMAISNALKKQYRAIGHNLHPIVTIAQKGLSDNIKLEIERALTDHELIKIKLVAADRGAKKELEETICAEFKAECVQSIGHTILLYRQAQKHDGRLSNIKRKKS
jgi:RNA-binding protein